jgi:PPOX class probable F420-dependent enzyme
MEIPQQFQYLLKDETKAFAILATVMPDGAPQETVVWFNWDGKNILLNSAQGRQKDRNMRRNPGVALIIIDFTNPYRYIEIRGKVTEVTEKGAVEHANALNQKYTGSNKYPVSPGEVRCMYRIEPEHVTTFG